MMQGKDFITFLRIDFIVQRNDRRPINQIHPTKALESLFDENGSRLKEIRRKF